MPKIIPSPATDARKRAVVPATTRWRDVEVSGWDLRASFSGLGRQPPPEAPEEAVELEVMSVPGVEEVNVGVPTQ